MSFYSNVGYDKTLTDSSLEQFRHKFLTRTCSKLDHIGTSVISILTMRHEARENVFLT